MTSLSPQPIQFDSVADIYDDYVRTDFDISFWLNEGKAVHGKVLELTCGTGRVSIPLLKAGIELTCVDYAPEMVARLRKKLEENNKSCPIICQDIADLNLPDRYELIFIPFHSFSELIDARKRRSALEKIWAHLTDSGIFICTLQNPTVRVASMDGAMHLVGEFPMSDGGKLVVNSRLLFDPSSQLAQGEQTYDLYAADGKVIDHRILDICFYLFHRNEFESLVREVGFEVTALYGDYNCAAFQEQSSPFMIWKLRTGATRTDSHLERTAA